MTFWGLHYERSGVFSVRGAYKLAYNIRYGTRWQASGSTSLDNTRNLWKLIWSSPVPNKVRVFDTKARALLRVIITEIHEWQLSLVIENCLSAEEAEAQAIAEGLKMGISYDLNPSTLESDCAAAVTASNRMCPDTSRC
jgi:hypothetical protein